VIFLGNFRVSVHISVLSSSYQSQTLLMSIFFHHSSNSLLCEALITQFWLGSFDRFNTHDWYLQGRLKNSLYWRLSKKAYLRSSTKYICQSHPAVSPGCNQVRNIWGRDGRNECAGSWRTLNPEPRTPRARHHNTTAFLPWCNTCNLDSTIRTVEIEIQPVQNSPYSHCETFSTGTYTM
jgi:hypothetical protein